MRCLPLISDYYVRFGKLPKQMIRGLAAYLLFLKNQNMETTSASTELNGRILPLTDAKAAILAEHFSDKANSTEVLIARILQDERLWPEAAIKATAGLHELVAATATAMEGMGLGTQIKL